MKKKESTKELVERLANHAELLGSLPQAARCAFDRGDQDGVRQIYEDASQAYPHLFGQSVVVRSPAAKLPVQPAVVPTANLKCHTPSFLTVSRQGQNLHYSWKDEVHGQQMISFRADRLALNELPERLSQLYQHASGSRSSHGQSALLEEVQHLGGLVYSSLVPDRVREIIDSATGGMHLHLDLDAAAVPWEFLWNGHDFISLKAPLTRQLSLCRDKTIAASRAKNLLAAGNTDNGSLPLVEDEIGQIVELYRNKTYPADSAVDDFSRSDLLSWTAGYGILHYAGHSETDSRSGNFWQCSDGKLRTRHLALLDRLPKLVFANCCGGASLGGQMLAQQLLLSGVRNYISPLWKVPDQAAMRFAVDFHRCLLEGENISRALFTARKNGSDQAGWAGYLAYCQPDTDLGSIF